MGKSVSVASSMYGFDQCFCLIGFMICFTDFTIFLSLKVRAMIPGTYLQMDSIFLPPPSMNTFDQYFCFIDFKIGFTDFMIFLSFYMGKSHDNLDTLIYGQEHSHPCMDLTCLIYLIH